MFYVEILERTSASGVFEKLEFPFDEGSFAHAMAKHGWEDGNNFSYRIINDNRQADKKTAWIVGHFRECSDLVDLNTVALIAGNISDDDFDRAVFYYHESMPYNAGPLSFANVMYQIQDLPIRSYEYSMPTNNEYERLGKEIAGRYAECGEPIPTWASRYIDYDRIGRDGSHRYFFDEDFYIYIDDCNIDEIRYVWNEFTNEWDWDLFKRCLAEEKEKISDTLQSTTNKLFEFLEVSA